MKVKVTREVLKTEKDNVFGKPVENQGEAHEKQGQNISGCNTSKPEEASLQLPQLVADRSKNGDVIMNTGTHQKLQLQNSVLKD